MAFDISPKMPYDVRYIKENTGYHPVLRRFNRMIDEIDRKIIMLLQQDARLPNTVLAEQVGSTSSTVHERVRKLERKGIIKGYVAVVDPERLGKTITAFIRLSLGAVADYVESKHCVMVFCEREPDVLECHGVAGEDCYMLKVRVSSPTELERLIERVRSDVSISRSVSNIVLSTIKETLTIKPALESA